MPTLSNELRKSARAIHMKDDGYSTSRIKKRSEDQGHQILRGCLYDLKHQNIHVYSSKPKSTTTANQYTINDNRKKKTINLNSDIANR